MNGDNTAPVERPRRRWGWWLAGLIFLLVIFTAGRLIYPKYRQQQLITQLKERGFTVATRQITGDWRAVWVSHPRLPHWLRTAYRREFVVSNPPGICNDQDFQLLTELVSWDEEWFHSPSRSWMSLNLSNATDHDLGWLQPRVQYLVASGTEITDDGLAPFRRTPHLNYLSLDARQIGDRGLAHLAGLKDLVELRLNGQHITDAGLVHLAGLTNLRTLRLIGTRVTGTGLGHLAALTLLEELDLTNSNLTGAGIEQLAKGFSLSRLILNGNPITDDGLTSLSKLPMLRSLHLRKTRVTDAGLETLSNLTSLQSLDLSENPITDSGLSRTPNLLRRVYYLNLKGTQVTNRRLLKLSDPGRRARLDAWQRAD